MQSRKFLKHLARDRLGSKSYFKNSRLQAYMVPIKTEIEGIFGPYNEVTVEYRKSFIDFGAKNFQKIPGSIVHLLVA